MNFPKRLILGLTAIFFVAPVLPARSQTPEGPEPPEEALETTAVDVTEPADSVVSLPEPMEPVPPPPPVSEDLISVSLDNVDMVDVVRMFTRISNANFVVAPSNLTGKVTVNLNNVPWEPAMRTILSSHNLVLIEKTPGSGIYSIEKRSPDAPEPLMVETIFLNYATVKEVEEALQPVLLPQARLSKFPSRNALVLKSTAGNLNEVKQVILEIDRMREQVFIEAKFMELNDDAIENLGINWQSLEGIGLSAGNLGWSYNNERNRLRSSDWSYEETYLDSFGNEQIARYDSGGNLIDTPEIETITTEFGDTTREVPVPIFTSEDITRRSKEGNYLAQDQYSRAVQDIRTAVLGMTDFNIILSALRETEGVSIVSNPKIIVANEEMAVIHIGQTERPFISTVTPATESSAPFTTYNPGEPVDFGVKLEVTPTVNTSSNISLLIEPTLTRFVRDAVAPSGQTYPIIANKKISTRFTLEDGKTVAIGGLTETDNRDVTSKIPLLGDIPLIGKYLFSHTHKERRQTETIIFVTVGLATPHNIDKDHGLPENTRLTQKAALRQRMEKRDYEKNLEEMRRAADSEDRELEPEVLDSTPSEDPPAVPESNGETQPDVSLREAGSSPLAEEVRRAFAR